MPRKVVQKGMRPGDRREYERCTHGQNLTSVSDAAATSARSVCLSCVDAQSSLYRLSLEYLINCDAEAGLVQGPENDVESDAGSKENETSYQAFVLRHHEPLQTPHQLGGLTAAGTNSRAGKRAGRQAGRQAGGRPA